jgi:hypothetical protein
MPRFPPDGRGSVLGLRKREQRPSGSSFSSIFCRAAMPWSYERWSTLTPDFDDQIDDGITLGSRGCAPSAHWPH